jgi:hypothetical protein
MYTRSSKSATRCSLLETVDLDQGYSFLHFHPVSQHPGGKAGVIAFLQGFSRKKVAFHIISRRLLDLGGDAG